MKLFRYSASGTEGYLGHTHIFPMHLGLYDWFQVSWMCRDTISLLRSWRICVNDYGVPGTIQRGLLIFGGELIRRSAIRWWTRVFGEQSNWTGTNTIECLKRIRWAIAGATRGQERLGPYGGRVVGPGVGNNLGTLRHVWKLERGLKAVKKIT